MGWFNKKIDDDDDQIGMPASRPPTGDLAVPSKGTGDLRPSAVNVTPVIKGSPEGASVTPSKAIPAELVEPPPPKAPTDYGIDQVVSLMRDLPNDNIELVVRVVKKTLDSVNISVLRLVEDAAARESTLEGKMASLRRGIAALEEEIQAKQLAISGLESEYKEVTIAKERLNLAQTLEAQTTPPRPAQSTPPGLQRASRPPPPVPTSPVPTPRTPTVSTPPGATPGAPSVGNKGPQK